ncbi:MAG TPA: NAD-glutamate dehydrogenase domain-containing protein, partial [Pseudomonadales bacterium]|nr:NAD-glutamate dehydrogenase domain-containing protein [Pseudomonadales bacterium]
MPNIRVDNKAAFQAGIEQRLNKREKNDSLKKFSRLYFSEVPIAEITRKDWAYAESILLSSWGFYSAFDGKKPLVRVFNPTEEKDGYEHKQTVIEVAAINIPFLLQSLRIELNTQHIVLSDVQQCLMNVVRDGAKVVITDEDDPNETLIHLEVNRITQTARLERDIREVIRYVQRAVDDFAPMRKQLLLLADEIGIASQHAHGAELQEDYEFLRWLYANNYTFIASEEFVRGESGEYEMVPGSALGLARKGFHCYGRPLELVEDVITVSKAPIRSRVHRPVYLDTITVKYKSQDDKERLARFTGLFTLTVYNQNPVEIPIVRKKVESIFHNTGLEPSSHKGRELARIIETLPREELFLSTFQELEDTVDSIFSLQERRIVRVLARRDHNQHFVNCLVFVPKDVYDTAIRLKIQDLLVQKFGAEEVDFTTLFSESALIRVHFVLRIKSGAPTDVDLGEVEREVSQLTRTWEEDLRGVIIRERGEVEGEALFKRFRNVFPPGYKDDYWPATAYADIEYLVALSEAEPLKVNLYEWVMFGEHTTRFKMYHLGHTLPLSDVIPILENLGAKTIEEHPYALEFEGQRIWVHDFVLRLTVEAEGGLEKLRENFQEAFLQIWSGGKENDGFNRLVPGALMDHREVAVIRAYARYFGQLQSSFSQSFIADCVTRYSDITRELFQMFDRRFNPNLKRNAAMTVAETLREGILEKIDAVENLADDRILRRYVEMILATQRTNYYQPDVNGHAKEFISFKFLPELISEMPLPKPKYEIFVYSPRVEGVHLRGGKVARGGLRWSDRTEDYRTEILGLVKAQQVKNSVIVPVGAKGGFLPKCIPDNASRDEIMEKGIACYKIFVQGLLDLTDNLVQGKVVPPENVVRHDDDDYYLVVAADKGTATFSDIANEISERHGFWLGDAFASGGSVGYDHKAMGITARGAWESVQQHFRDLGINIQEQDFTVVGIGDMSGDVFGNGMLLSEHICLVAAFNHMHIFIDPSPDPARSFAERKRLFDLPRSGWSDYEASLISRGGGVFSRAAKSVTITPEMKQLFDITENQLTPNRLIHAILQARVDLLWNGGIGTYVKSHTESHQDVG